MKMEIIKENENVILGRKELLLFVENDGATISRDDIVNKLALKFQAEKEQIVVQSIETQYGTSHLQVRVKIYETVEERDAVEKKHMLVRNKHQEAEVKE